MRLYQNGAVLLLICALTGTFSAQQRKVAPAASSAKTAPQNLLLAADDGLTVIAAALDARNRLSPKADCSHLVHDIYERAGFSYSYVPSSGLYAGIAEFRRVTRPQPGDLIVWPGHVGIVVSPTRHTFYSSLRSGLGVEPYDSDYWKQRGRPRFLRYVKEVSAVQTSSSKIPALKSTSLETIPSLEPADVSGAEVLPANPPEPTAVQFPRLLIVESTRPTPQEVSETVMNALSQTADGLRGKNIFDLPQAFVVLSRIEVERIKIKDTTGWADLQLTQSASLVGGQSNLKKRQQKQRWTLHRRDGQSWELIVPQGTMYLNQDDAVRLLAQQLATMTAEGSSTDTHQKAQMVALLGSLLHVKN
jgi:hypothetical protein